MLRDRIGVALLVFLMSNCASPEAEVMDEASHDPALLEAILEDVQ